MHAPKMPLQVCKSTLENSMVRLQLQQHLAGAGGVLHAAASRAAVVHACAKDAAA